MKSEHESSIYELFLVPGSFFALHGTNLANWLEDVLFGLIYRGVATSKEVERELV